MQPALKKPCAALQACEWYRAESVFVFFFFVHIFNKELKTARVPRTSMYAQWSVRECTYTRFFYTPAQCITLYVRTSLYDS